MSIMDELVKFKNITKDPELTGQQNVLEMQTFGHGLLNDTQGTPWLQARSWLMALDLKVWPVELELEKETGITPSNSFSFIVASIFL